MSSHPPSHPLRRPLAEASRWLEIIRFKTYANLRAEIEKTYLGCLWWILEPVLNTLVYTTVFSVVFHQRGHLYIAFIYIGNTIYSWFAGGLSMGANALVANASLYRQVYMPKFIFPIILVSNASWKFLASFIVLLLFLWGFHFPPHLSYLYLPLLFLLQYILIVGLSMVASVIVIYFHDFRTVLNTLIAVLMWFSGIFYGADKIPEKFRILFNLNPIGVLIESFRAVLLQGAAPNLKHLGCVSAEIAVVIGCGLAMLHRIDRTVAKRTV